MNIITVATELTREIIDTQRFTPAIKQTPSQEEATRNKRQVATEPQRHFTAQRNTHRVLRTENKCVFFYPIHPKHPINPSSDIMQTHTQYPSYNTSLQNGFAP